MAVNKGLELLRDPERGGVAAVGVVFSSLGTDFRISELSRNLIVTTNLKSYHKLDAVGSTVRYEITKLCTGSV